MISISTSDRQETQQSIIRTVSATWTLFEAGTYLLDFVCPSSCCRRATSFIFLFRRTDRLKEAQRVLKTLFVAVLLGKLLLLEPCRCVNAAKRTSFPNSSEEQFPTTKPMRLHKNQKIDPALDAFDTAHLRRTCAPRGATSNTRRPARDRDDRQAFALFQNFSKTQRPFFKI